MRDGAAPESDERSPVVALRALEISDLRVLFEHEQDPASAAMAAVHPRAEQDFRALWSGAVADPRTTARAILADGELVGRISTFLVGDELHVGYWVARSSWGRGIATTALRRLVAEVEARPVHAVVAAHNAASLCVLERCGFRAVGERDSAETARYRACREILLILD